MTSSSRTSIGGVPRTAVLAILAGIAVLPVVALAKEREVDHQALAALLARDGHFDRAARALQKIEPPRDAAKRQRYFQLAGYIALKQRLFVAAATHFSAAISAAEARIQAMGKTKSARDEEHRARLLYLFLAQARYGQKDYQGALKAIVAARGVGDHLPATYILRSECLARTGQLPQAFAVADQGSLRHPTSSVLARQRIVLLIRLGLYQQATEDAVVLLDREDLTAQDYIAIAEALRRGKAASRAIAFLEMARLRFPKSKGLVLQLGRAYLDQKRALSAATIFERALIDRPDLALETAELFRRSGRLHRALRANARVVDQKTKIRQRLGLLIELEAYEQAAALTSRLSRLNLLEEDNVRYALAYAYFKTLRFEQAEKWLKQIHGSKLFDRAVELRRAVDTCVAHRERCL